MPESNQVSEILTVPLADRGIEWLISALQIASQLEFATIPPYLCAMWSIKSGEGRAYDHLREVVIEEMLHLGLVCNLLTTIGATPKLYPDAAPAYPCKLPGGIRPTLEVPLCGLTRQGIKGVFMEIEKPHHDISGIDPQAETDPTIGDLYDAIGLAFEAVPPTSITGWRQVAKMLPIRPGVKAHLFKIESLDDVRKAIFIIKEQGEGTALLPFDDSKGIDKDLAHYFRFAELFEGRELTIDDAGAITFNGPEIPFPDTFPMAVVPLGGYAGPDVPPETAAKLIEFDNSYTSMLKQLQAAWEPNPTAPAEAQPGKLTASIGDMFSLTSIAAELMAMELTVGGPNYGPCFRLV
ncbi:MAG: ferritin-like protein [Pirellula sp.]